MELLIGAGSNHAKKISPSGRSTWDDLITLDINPDHKPDVVHDLEELPYPFNDNLFSEIHAYEVLEHTGQQGDYRFFFGQWEEFWRILKPNGLMIGTSPAATSAWAWGDPGHCRLITPESFTFLCQPEYVKQVGVSPMSDYRFCYHADFEPVYLQSREDTFAFALRAIKPSRINGEHDDGNHSDSENMGSNNGGDHAAEYGTTD